MSPKEKKSPHFNSTFFFPLCLLALTGTWTTLTAFCLLGCCHCFSTQAQVALPWWKRAYTHSSTATRTRAAVLPLTRCYLKINCYSLWETSLAENDERFICFQSSVIALDFNDSLIWDEWSENDTIRFSGGWSVWGLWCKQHTICHANTFHYSGEAQGVRVCAWNQVHACVNTMWLLNRSNRGWSTLCNCHM